MNLQVMLQLDRGHKRDEEVVNDLKSIHSTLRPQYKIMEPSVEKFRSRRKRRKGEISILIHLIVFQRQTIVEGERTLHDWDNSAKAVAFLNGQRKESVRQWNFKVKVEWSNRCLRRRLQRGGRRFKGMRTACRRVGCDSQSGKLLCRRVKQGGLILQGCH